MWVGEIDVLDDGLVRRYWEAGKEADGFQRPYSAFWPLQAATVAFRSTTNSVEQHPIVAMEGHEVLGTNQVVLPILDNTHVAYLEPLVRPPFRRRGVGAVLLEAGLAMARDKDRTTVIAEVDMPLDGPSDGHDFLARRGFETGLLDVHRVLDLPLEDSRLDELAAGAAPHHAAYEFVAIGDSVPERHMDGYCALQAAFNREAPMGDLDVAPEVWDADRVRKTEERFREQGRRQCLTVAVARDGSLAALTEMMANDQQPEIGVQAGTLVLKEHRGHRLGLGLKVANLRTYQSRFPGVRVVHSWNAEDNAPMVAINDVIGFRPVERLAEMQRRL